VTYKWVEGISARFETTVLTSHPPGWRPEDSPVEAVKIVNWLDPELPHVMRRLDWAMKPQYMLFWAQVRRWFKQRELQGERFDVVHQINPKALRYPYPLIGSTTPYIMGPVAGSLPTPSGFEGDEPRYMQLREVDRLRLKWDPWLRSTYENASLVLGAVPYVAELLKDLSINRFEVMFETSRGVEPSLHPPKQAPEPGDPLRLLYVGRIIRTKGVPDAIRAIAHTAPGTHVELDVVGGGAMLEDCKQEARRLGVADAVHFHGRVKPTEVKSWYERSHALLFPSFREPKGNVVLEALNYGLPVITSTIGGPGHYVTDACGYRVEPRDPETYSTGLARAIDRLAGDRAGYPRRSEAALARAAEIAAWPPKLQRLSDLYHEIAANGGRGTAGRHPAHHQSRPLS
jgi:glycosyltransferase involved in cell wall biosynthesis